jgi:hypothetical protein
VAHGCCFGAWLDFLGENRSAIGRLVDKDVSRVAHAALGSYRPDWAPVVADYLGIRHNILMDVHPLDAGARQYRDKALFKSAARRLTRPQNDGRAWRTRAKAARAAALTRVALSGDAAD